MVKLRFLLAWGAYPAGAIIEPNAILRGQLLATRWYGEKIVEEVPEEKPQAKSEEPAPVLLNPKPNRKRSVP